MSGQRDFYEEDEDVEQVAAAFDAGEKALTRRVRGVEVSRPSPQWQGGDPDRPVRIKVAGVAYQDLAADDAVALAVQLLHHAQAELPGPQTEVEYGVRAGIYIAQLKSDFGDALACAARYQHVHGYEALVQQRDVTDWRDLVVPAGTPIPRVVTCRHNPEPHVLDEDKVDDGGCVDVVDVELPPAVAAAVTGRPHG